MEDVTQKLVQKYIKLCMNLCVSPHDYTTKNVRKHNKAMKELRSYALELSQDARQAEDVFSVLLTNSNPRVRVNAAANCLRLGLCIEDAVKVLEELQRGDYKLLSFDAEMVLRVWRGEISGSSL